MTRELKGKVLHLSGQNTEIPNLEDIALTLKSDFGADRNAIKVVMRWTGASERAVEYWLPSTSKVSHLHWRFRQTVRSGDGDQACRHNDQFVHRSPLHH